MQNVQERFWGLVAPLQKKLYNFVHKSLNFNDESADVFQEVLVRAFRYFPSFDPDRSFSTWIYAIAANEIRRHCRTRRDRETIPISGLEIDPRGEIADPVVARVYDAAKALPIKQRQVFFLFYYNGFSLAEIADITGLREGNIKFILHRARAAVKDILEVNHETG